MFDLAKFRLRRDDETGWMIGLVLMGILWSALVAGSLAWDLHQQKQSILNAAATAARTNINKDQSFRKWANSHGGVYVPPTEHTPPNPYLNVPDRDVVTTTGKTLTLMNHAYVLRQMQSDFPDNYGTKSHITSLKPLNPNNAPDAWEAKALHAFEQGSMEFLEAQQIDGQPYLRMMLPLIVEPGCLKCHAQQGYKIDGIRDGISSAVSLAPFLAREQKLGVSLMLTHGAAWLIGLAGLAWLGVSFRRVQRLETRARAAAAVEESARRFRAVTESANDAIISADSIGKVVGWNAAAERLFGYTEAEINGQPLTVLMPERFRNLHKEGLARVMAGGVPHLIGKTVEVFGLRKDGSEFPLEISLAQWQAAEGQFFTAIIRDITARQQTEQALQESESKYRRLIENSPDIVYTFSVQRGSIYCSSQVIPLLGYSVEHLYAHPFLWNNSIHPEDRAVVAKAIEEFKTGAPFKIEYRIKNAHGDWHWFYDRAIGGREENGDFIIEGLAMDITERKQAEEALLQNEADLRTLVEHSPVAIIVDVGVDADEKIMMMNRKFTELFGYTLEDVPDVLHWWLLAYPDEKYREEVKAEWIEKVGKAIQSHSDIEPMETTVTCKDGSNRYIRFSLSSLGGRNIITFEDLTERKRAEAALARHARNLGERIKEIECLRDITHLLLNTEMSMEQALDACVRRVPAGWLDPSHTCARIRLGEQTFETANFRETEWKLAAAITTPTSEPGLIEVFYFGEVTGNGESPFLDEEHTLIQSISIQVAQALEKRLAEKTLRESEARYRNLVETTNDIIWETDENAVYTYVNSRIHDILGYAAAEIIGKTPFDLMPPEEARRVADIFARIAAARESFTGLENSNLHKDGHPVALEASGAPVIDTTGKFCGYRGIDRDITGRKQAETKILAAHAELQGMLDASNRACQAMLSMIEDQKRADESLRKLSLAVEQNPNSIVITGLDGNIEYVNAAFTKATGYSSAEVVGKNPSLMSSGKTPKASYDDLWAHLTRGEVWKGEFINRHKDGSEYIESVLVSPVRQTDGRVTNYLAIEEDITERKRMEAEVLQLNAELENKVATRTADLEHAKLEAEQANRAKSEFLATMSHEIRTPMNGVIGMLEVLQQSSLTGPQVEMANVIHDSAFSLLAVINDILDFSKIEAGKLQIESIPMSVADVVEGVCESLYPLALKKGVELTLFTDPAIPAAVMGDAGRLRQVLINLANNAIKFSSGQQRQGKVSVRALLAGSSPGQSRFPLLNPLPQAGEEANESLRDVKQILLEFRIADNGIGMDEATQARLFAPFTQADSSTTRSFGGTGLGLVIARQLARIMGDEITLHSGLGKGTTINVRLPFALPSDVDRDLSRHDGDGVGMNPDLQNPNLVAGLSCLVADGAESLADDLTAYLVHAGAVVEQAVGLAAAKQWIASRPPGLCVVIIDTAGSKQPLDELRATARARPNLDARFVAIERGGRRHCRIVAADLVDMDAEVMHRRAFLDAVAIAAGRAKQPDLEGKHGAANVKPLLSREEARRRGSLILVAEDNEINQKVILQQLMLLGQTADIASNGREALKRWQSGDYAILFADLHMPEMDGYELTAAIRAAEKAGASETNKARLPIIAFTANAIKGEAERCLALGMDDYLSKPVQLVSLKAMLEKWMPMVTSDPIPAATTSPKTAPAALPVHDGRSITDRFVHALETKTPPCSADELAHEFQVQQIELQMQNEELRQAQIALEASRDRYANLYEFSPVGYLTLTDSGMIAEANLTSATLLGAERTKLLQRRFDSFVAPEYCDLWHRLFMSVMQDARAAINLALQRDDGSSFNAHLDCRRDDTGQAKPVLCLTVTDLSERKLDEAAPTPDSSLEPNRSFPLPGGGDMPVDVNVLKALIGDDAAMIREFLHDFRVSAAKIAVELRTACAAGQAAAVGAAAHKLKSSARSVGALALGELCAGMEKAGKAGDTAALAVLLPKFEQELASVESYLEGY